MIENTALVVNLYRPPVTDDLFSDTVLNSTVDVLAMLAGYWLAGRLPAWASTAAVVGIVLFVGYWIRDDVGIT